jgi:hypothetical protein
MRQSGLQMANQQFVDASKFISNQGVDTQSAGIYSLQQLVVAYPHYYVPRLGNA